LNDLVAVAQKDSLASTLPFLDVGERELVQWPDRRVLLGERELKRLKLLVAIKIAFEML
jgi:hypothetical protein